MNQERRLIEWDWLTTDTGRRLHFAEVSDEVAVEIAEWAMAEDVKLACGLTVSTVRIPGIFSRMSEPRCHRCCTTLGYPQGIGSPKNDDACRPLVQRRVDA